MSTLIRVRTRKCQYRMEKGKKDVNTDNGKDKKDVNTEKDVTEKTGQETER